MATNCCCRSASSLSRPTSCKTISRTFSRVTNSYTTTIKYFCILTNSNSIFIVTRSSTTSCTPNKNITCFSTVSFYSCSIYLYCLTSHQCSQNTSHNNFLFTCCIFSHFRYNYVTLFGFGPNNLKNLIHTNPLLLTSLTIFDI